MAKGDAVGNVAEVNAGAYMTIQPGANKEWIIHNVYTGAEAELYIVEGTNELLFDAHTEKGAWANFIFHLTESHYLKVKNTNVGTKLIGYDGIVSFG